MLRSKFVLSIFLAAVLSGCTTYLTVESDPEGATISSISGSRTYGYAPVQIPLTKDSAQVNDECVRTEGLSAQWPSGAVTQTAPVIELCDPQHNNRLMMRRPNNAPDKEKDLEWALKLTRERALKAEAEKRALENRMNDPWYSPYWGPHWYYPYGYFY